MSSPFKAKGFKAHREEVEKREALRESLKGKLFRFFLKDGEEDIPVRFVTEEPLLFYEHQFKEAGKPVSYLCTGDDCEHCDKSKPSLKGAWLIVDGRTFEVDERDSKGNKTGKKKKVKDRLKLLVRGTTDLAKLDRLNTKYGLADRIYTVTKVGSGNATTYEFDRGEEDPLTKTQLKELLSQLPEEYRGLDPYEIVEKQIFGFDNDDESEEDTPKRDKESVKNIESRINSGVKNSSSKSKLRKKETQNKSTKKLRKK